MDSAVLVALQVAAVATAAGALFAASRQQRRERQMLEEAVRDQEAFEEELQAVHNQIRHTTDAMIVDTEASPGEVARARAFAQETRLLERRVSHLEDRLSRFTRKGFWERWGSVVATMLGAAAVVAAAWLGAAPPDCTGYVQTLISVSEASPSPDVAVRAAESLTWGNLDDECGSPGGFIRELASAP